MHEIWMASELEVNCRQSCRTIKGFSSYFLPMFVLVTTGLGSKVEDICGRDWVESGGDHGDTGHIYFTRLSRLNTYGQFCHSCLTSFPHLESSHAVLVVEKIKSISYTTISELCLKTIPFSPISMH